MPAPMLYTGIATTNQLYTESNTVSRLESQTVTFRDSSPEWEVGIKSGDDVTRDKTYSGDVQLQEFFQRPIQISAFTWTPGTTFTPQALTPWATYLTNPRVSNRIANYKNMSAKLCVKFLVNGNAFYYGRLMAFYAPIPDSDGASTFTLGVVGKMLGSQRVKLFLDPTESVGGVMKMPFFWHYDKVDLTSSLDFNSLGRINIIALNELKHANASTSPVSVTVYAWLEDVKLSSPTAVDPPFITTQAGGDEYGDGLISGPASAVAKMSGKLSTAPVIGKYMKATSVMGGAVSSVAKMFGMSRPAILNSSSAMQPSYVSGFAVTDSAVNVAKLTVDSKQELTIDPSVTGANGGDEMELSHLANIETYITTFAWAVASVPKTILFAARPTPQHYYRSGTPAYTTVTASGFVANAFKYWRGTMRYRFQIVASGFHKGRLLVVWDPVAGATAPETNVQFSKVIDITTEKDITVDIGWGAQTSWLVCNDLVNPYYSVNALTYTTADTTRTTNGVLTVYVLNDLTTPNSVVNNDIQVNVFASMCNAEFSAPHSRISTYSVASVGVTPQAGGDLETSPVNNEPTVDEGMEALADCKSLNDATDLVYMGESVQSFRQLIKRYNRYTTTVDLGATAGYYFWDTADFPLKRGYTSYGFRNGTTYLYNDTMATVMLSYMAFGFIAYRGGVRWRVVQKSNGITASTMSIERRDNTGIVVPGKNAYNTTSSALAELQALQNVQAGLSGMHLTPSNVQPVLEVELPFYSNARFVACRTPYDPTVSGLPQVYELSHTFISQTNGGGNYYTYYVSGAEDSTFSMFQGCMPFQVNGTFT